MLHIGWCCAQMLFEGYLFIHRQQLHFLHTCILFRATIEYNYHVMDRSRTIKETPAPHLRARNQSTYGNAEEGVGAPAFPP